MKYQYIGLGRRKTSVARVFVNKKKSAGVDNKNTVEKEDFMINSMPYYEYLKGSSSLALWIFEPFEITNTKGDFVVHVNVKGGGLSGQAQAIKHGLSRVLLAVDSGYRSVLKAEKFLTRDSRMVERKKYGQRGARRKFQFKKR